MKTRQEEIMMNNTQAEALGLYQKEDETIVIDDQGYSIVDTVSENACKDGGTPTVYHRQGEQEEGGGGGERRAKTSSTNRRSSLLKKNKK